MLDPTTSQPVRIVVADDHAVVRAGISTALQDLPAAQIVAEVGDGPAVFAALAQLHPDVLVIDVQMPDFDPLRAMRQLRALYPQLRILVVSAHDDDVYVQGLLQAGVNGYHLKDQPLADLRLAVQRVCAGERWVSSSLIERLMARPAPVTLTQRQRQLLWCLQQGYDNQTIAQRMNLSVKTVENHLTRLYRHLDVQSRLEAVRVAASHAELPLPLDWSAAPSLTLLVIDDNARYRQQLQRMIAALYPQALVLEAATCAEALEVALQEPPRLALIDVVLGDEDGITCAQHLRETIPGLRMLLMTAYPDRAFQQRAHAIGALALIDKKDLDRASLRVILSDSLGE